MKNIFALIFAALLALSCLALTACTDEVVEPGQFENGTQADNNEVTPENMINSYITFTGSSYTATDTSALSVDGSALVIGKAGTYEISGTLDNGQIIVAVSKAERVTLIFNNFTGSNSSSAVIWVKSADKVYLEMKEGTINTLTDASTYVFPSPAETKPNACIYASDDLTIKGHGSLIVNGNYNNGIGCKNDITINDAKVVVNAVNNAVKGNGSVTIKGDAEVVVESAEDAIKTDSLDVGKGFLTITENAKVTVTCQDDGLQATQSITITTGATVITYAGGNAVNCDGSVTIDEGCLTENVPGTAQ